MKTMRGKAKVSPMPQRSTKDVNVIRECVKNAAAGTTTASLSSSPPSEQPSRSVDELDFSFACGGWLKLYMFGAAKYLQDSGLANKEVHRFIGTSAGALAALGLAVDADFDAIKSYVLDDILPRAHSSLPGYFNVRQYLRDTLNQHGRLNMFKDLNASESLTVCYSSLFTASKRRVSKFDSEEDLMQTLLASCCATPIAGVPFRHKGEFVFDGALTDFQPVFHNDIADEKQKTTICVSPFYCVTSEIRPSKYVPMWWALCPPKREQLEWLFDLGYDDAQSWAYANGYVTKEHEMESYATTNKKTKASKYNQQWTTNVNRLAGYQILENQLLDMLFMIFVGLLWRPLAFLLLYVELVLRVLIFAGTSIVYGVACKLMRMISITGIIIISLLYTPAWMIYRSTSSNYEYSFTNLSIAFVAWLSFICMMLLTVVCISGGVNQATERARKDYQIFCICLRNIGSLSLLMRTIPIVGSSIPIKRHAFLYEYSLIYRLTIHFV